eukprot:TRINITY_DN29273_c0_g3_i1.p1 TRINITY_DN29273_c0_g3~~TRINITY_DN29273_c0_g3_i1.p1  ORF type:complete len:1181 (-),score=241.39 TRINITY_DN29273_c0_g3_i1:266-3808(-)
MFGQLQDVYLEWSELPARMMPASNPALLKDVEECGKQWTQIHKERSGHYVTADYRRWLCDAEGLHPDCIPFFGNGSGNVWYCEICRKWSDLRARGPYHMNCAVQGGRPVTFKDFSGDSIGQVLHFTKESDGMLRVSISANFSQLLARLAWASYWPADQLKASVRLVPRDLPVLPAAAKGDRQQRRQPSGSDGYDGYDWGIHQPGASRGIHQAGSPAKRRRRESITSYGDEGEEDEDDEDSGPQFSLASCAEIDCAPQPEAFQIPLFPIQCRTLAWMRDREERPLEYLSREVIRRTFLSSDIDVELRVDRHWQSVRGGILADSVGYGKTACMIGLIQVGLQRPLADIFSSQELEDLSKRFIVSNATLVITPPNLFEQWLGEFKKFLKPALFEQCKVIEIPHIHRLNKLSVEDLANAEVVIVPYRFFFSGVYDRYMDETIGRNEHQDGETQEKMDQAVRYAILRSFLVKLLGVQARLPSCQANGMRKTVAGQELPVDILERMAPTLEAFYWRRIVFDEFHEVLGIREGRPYHALRQCYAKFHWGLTATPRLGNARDVADMASLLHISIPPHSDTEAQHFLNEWVRSSTWDTSSVPLENRIVHVRHTKQERLLYLHKRNAVVNRRGRASKQDEEHLLQLCSHFSQGDEIEDEEGSTNATSAVMRRRAGLHDELEKLRESLQAAQAELPGQKRRWEAACQLREVFQELGLVSGAASRGADLAVGDAHRLSAELGAEELERLVETIRSHLPPKPEVPDEAGNGDAAQQIAGATMSAEAADSNLPAGAEGHPAAAGVAPVITEALKLLLQDLARTVARIKHGGYKPKFKPNGRELESTCHALESAVAQNQAQIQSLEQSIRFFENTFKVLEDESGEKVECPICMEDALPRDCAITSCGHLFHADCIRMVVNEHHHCPTCRAALVQKDVNFVQHVLDESRGESAAQQEDAPGDAPEYGSKMAKIVETLRQVRQEEKDAKVIMFCQWERILKFMAKTLVQLGEPPPLVLRGSMPQRQCTIRDFVGSNDPKHSVLLLSLERSPTGMNLVSGRHLFLVHPMYAQTRERAVAFELQAIGRLRRQGQKRKVIVHRFVTAGTIEEEITRRHQTHLDEVEQKQRQDAKSQSSKQSNLPAAQTETDERQEAGAGSSSSSSSSSASRQQQQAPQQGDAMPPEAGASEVQAALQSGL